MESCQLFSGNGLGAVAHPFLCLDAFAQCSLQVLHEVHHAFLGCCGEIFFHIHLSYNFTQHTVYCINGTFPARLVHLTAGQYLAVEIEAGSHEVIAQTAGSSVDQVILQIRNMFFQRQGADQFVHCLQRFNLFHVQFFHALYAQTFQVSIPVNSGELLLQVSISHLVIISFRITALNSAERSLCNGCFDFQYIVHLLLSLSICETCQLEQLGDVEFILFTDVGSHAVCIQVIFLFAKVDTSLTDLENIQSTVLRVCIYIAAEIGTNAVVCHFGDHRNNLLAVADGCNFVQLCLDGSYSVAVQFHTVHSQCIKITDLLSLRARLICLRCKAFNQFAKLLPIGFSQHIKRSVAGIFGSQRMTVIPSATSITEEVRTCGNCRVKVCQINTGSILHFLLAGTTGHCGKSHCCNGHIMFSFHKLLYLLKVT